MFEHIKRRVWAAAAGAMLCLLFTVAQELLLGQTIIIKSLLISVVFGGTVALLLRRYVSPCLQATCPRNLDRIEERVNTQGAELLRVHEQLTALYEVGRAITASLQLNVVLNTIARSSAELIGSDTGGILLLDETEQRLRIQGAYGLSDATLDRTLDCAEECIACRAIGQGRTVIANDLPNNREFYTPLTELEGLLACASVPLRIGSRIIGTLDVYSKSQRHAFDIDDVHILEMLASQAAIAIENAWLYEDLQHANADLESRVRERTNELLQANEKLNSEIRERKHAEEALAKERNLLRTLIDNLPDNIYAKDLNSRFLVANRSIADFMGVSKPEELLGHTDFDFYPPKLAECFYQDEQRILKSDRVLLNKEESLVNLGNGKDGWLLTSKIPFRDAHGQIAGFVGVGHDITERKFIQDQLKLYAEELELLNQTNGLLQSCKHEKDTYKVLTEMCQKAFPLSAGSLYITHTPEHNMTMVRSWGEFIPHSSSLSSENLTLESVQKTLGESPETAFVMASFEFEDDRAYLFAPIAVSQELLGLLALCFHREGGPSNNAHYHSRLIATRSLASRIVGSYALTLMNLRLREQLRIDAIRDPLTGLYNRRYMEHVIKQEESRSNRHHSDLGIIMFDVDHFKRFNDTHGHEVGDAVLRGLGALLKDQFRGEDVACRYGGEEFLIILTGASLEAAKQRAQEIWGKIADLTIEYQGQNFSVTASIGVADLKHHGPEVLKVISAADKALYLAKKSGRNQVVVAAKESEEDIA